MSNNTEQLKKYSVTGTIELNFCVIVEAENEEEARKLGCEYAEDGHGHGESLCVPDAEDAEAQGIITK